MARNPASEPSGEARRGLIAAKPHVIGAPSGASPGIHALGLGSDRDGALYVPSASDPKRPAPLILALHGAGGVAAQGTDLLAGAAEAAGALVLAPESRGRTWDIILGGYGPDVAFIDRALAHVFALQAIDPGRIAVAGFSDGASYALSLGLANGGLFSDILAFSPGFMAPAEEAGSPRIFVSHGVRDEVLPIGRCSRRLVPALRRAGYDVDYREFDGGHVVPDEMVRAAVARFLQPRGAAGE